MSQLEPKKKPSVICSTEYGKLTHVIVCEPEYMQIREAINETQKHYLGENIKQSLAKEQHRQFVKKLEGSGAEVTFLSPKQSFNEQVFTRDIGFCVDQHFFVANMASPLRDGEERELVNWLQNEHINYTQLTKGSIEGGDVVVDGKNVWVGLSGRTTVEAITELQQYLPDYQVTPLKLKEEILHLDCVFNIIGPGEAIIYRDSFSETDIAKLEQIYRLYDVSEEEQFSLGPNVLSVAPGTLLSLPQNKNINKTLTEAGYKIEEVEFSEIIKSGGSFRCCSLPLVRGS